MNPARVRRAVVFPQPDGPSRVKNSPCLTGGSARDGDEVTEGDVDVLETDHGNLSFWRLGLGLADSRAAAAGVTAGSSRPTYQVFEFDLFHPGAMFACTRFQSMSCCLSVLKNSTTSGLALAAAALLTGMEMNCCAHSPWISALPNQSMNFSGLVLLVRALDQGDLLDGQRHPDGRHDVSTLTLTTSRVRQ